MRRRPDFDTRMILRMGEHTLVTDLSSHFWRRKRFQRLRARGWQIISHPRFWSNVTSKEVRSTTKKGLLTHGGDHTAGEIKDSPKRTGGRGEPRPAPRGKRGGRRRKARTPFGERGRSRTEGGSFQRVGGVGIYTPTPIKQNSDILDSAKESAELLRELVGRGNTKTPKGVEVNPERLLIALEVGDNPLPALQAVRERPKMRVLLSPDLSGSTQSWSGLAQAWAIHIARDDAIEAIYWPNCNGEFEERLPENLSEIDVLIYLGDMDGYDLCRSYASKTLVLALDSYCANIEKPRLREVRENFYWVDRVSAKAPGTWTQALRLCLRG